jgi:hypothetical protein
MDDLGALRGKAEVAAFINPATIYVVWQGDDGGGVAAERMKSLVQSMDTG